MQQERMNVIAHALSAIFENDALCSAYDACNNMEELKALLAANYISVTEEELLQMQTIHISGNEGDELLENQLDAVAGGGKGWKNFKKGLKDIWKSCKKIWSGSHSDAFESGVEFAKKGY